MSSSGLKWARQFKTGNTFWNGQHKVVTNLGLVVTNVCVCVRVCVCVCVP